MDPSNNLAWLKGFVLINYLPKNIGQCIIEIKLASASLCENDLENWKKKYIRIS